MHIILTPRLKEEEGRERFRGRGCDQIGSDNTKSAKSEKASEEKRAAKVTNDDMDTASKRKVEEGESIMNIKTVKPLLSQPLLP
ncbi:hypothetical protein FRC12_020175 [Ceratobasidium sp. 428]|nr:hypothetical protein FRC12_020175 [Ceratobasidium sp. 428]